MIVIDIAERAAARAAPPRISFRRTDADRRPPRAIVRMPNDGPLPDREARSTARLEALRRRATLYGFADDAPLLGEPLEDGRIRTGQSADRGRQ